MKSSSEKSSAPTSTPATQAVEKPFFPKAGEGDFFKPAGSGAPAVQAKMTVNKPGDKFEQEADKMADKVMRMPDPAPATTSKEEKIQRAPDEKVQKRVDDRIMRAEMKDDKVQKAEAKEEKIQKAEMKEDKVQKAEAKEDKIQKAEIKEEKVQRKDGSDGSSSSVGAHTQSAIQSKAGGGQPLSSDVRSHMEPRFHADFSNIRIHNDPESASLSNHLGARAFTYQNNIFFSRDQYQPGTSEGKQLLAHELTHTIQQGHAEQHSPQVSTTTTPPPVQRLGVQDVLDYFADKAYHIPGFRLLTIILGVNPINMRSAPRTAANILRGLVELIPGGHFISQALDNHGVFNKAGAWVEQKLSVLGDIGSDIIAGLKRFIDSLSWTDIFDLGGVWDRAKRIFTDPIKRLIDFGVSVAVEILKMVKDAILKPLAALAQGTRGYDLLKAVLGEDPITGEPVPRNADTLIGGFMKLIGQEEVWQNIKQGNAIARAWAWFQGALSGLMGMVRAIPRKIIDTLTSLTFMDILTVAGALSKIIGAFVNIATDFIKWGVDQVISLLEILFSVVAPGAVPYIAKAKSAFKTIIKNPIAFVGNLVRAGKLGFQNFANNILTHLKTALIKWITGPLGDAGVYIPKSFDLMEIIKLVLSVLGLTWQNIRGKLVKIIPEPVLIVLEKTAGILVTLVKDGPAAAWQEIKAELTELKDQMIAKITEMVTTEVVKAAVMKLVSMLNPAGAFVQAIMAIYNTITFFIQKINQIAAVVGSFIDSVAAIASGQVTAAAQKVEQTMANTLTIIIAFLAKFAGLGNIPEKVVGIIKKIRQPIDKGLDKIVGWLGGILQKMRGKDSKQDTRTEQEKTKDVQAAAKDAEKVAKEFKTKREIKKHLSKIKEKYRLKSIDILEKEGDKFQIFAEINPKAGTEVFIEDDGLGNPSGSAPPLKKFLAQSHSNKKRNYCEDSSGKLWFYNMDSKNWQITSDKTKLLEAEKKGTEWLKTHKSEFESLVEADKSLNSPGFDQLGLQTQKGDNPILHIGETKGAFGKGPQYFTPLSPSQVKSRNRENPFTAITDNLGSNLEREQNKSQKAKVEAALKSGNVEVTIFLAGKAEVSDKSIEKIKKRIQKELVQYLIANNYLNKDDAKEAVKGISVKKQKI